MNKKKTQFDCWIDTIERRMGKKFKEIEITILKRVYDRESYEQIAASLGYSGSYIRHIGSSLWVTLTFYLKKRVVKNNLRSIFDNFSPEELVLMSKKNRQEIPLPEGIVFSDSKFYVERQEIESICSQNLTSRGGLIKIFGSAKMGKTSLMKRTLDLTKNCRSVYVNLKLAEGETLSDLSKFLKWLCVTIETELKLPSKLKYYWDEDIGAKLSCSSYLKKYLLASIEQPLILAFDKLEYLFENEQEEKEKDLEKEEKEEREKRKKVAINFLSLLRGWHENSRMDLAWSKLRLILAYSKNYPLIDSDNSPFNVGKLISQLGFSADQILKLVGKHGLKWEKDEVKKLMNALSFATTPKVGGSHPYLVRQALYEIVTQNLTLDEFLEQDLKKRAPYENYQCSNENIDGRLSQRLIEFF